jgi:hypothetical protein
VTGGRGEEGSHKDTEAQRGEGGGIEASIHMMSRIRRFLFVYTARQNSLPHVERYVKFQLA